VLGSGNKFVPVTQITLPKKFEKEMKREEKEGNVRMFY
jgi:hypothetical protein